MKRGKKKGNRTGQKDWNKNLSKKLRSSKNLRSGYGAGDILSWVIQIIGN